MESPFRVIDVSPSTPPRTPAHDEVLVGVGSHPFRAPAGFDVLLTGAEDAPRPWVACTDPESTARRLAGRVDRHPQAALALVHVLRMGAALTPPERLLVESLAYATLQGGADFRAWLTDARRPASRPAAQPVRLGRNGDRLTIVLDRPQARNAFDAAARDALCEALDVAVADPSVTRVDLRGAGPAFCSGGDLSEFGTSRDTAEAHRIRMTRSPAALLLRCADKVTAHLHGACVGAGVELAAFAGRVTATTDTVIRLPEVEMGLIPGAGGTASLPLRIGRERTAYLALSGVRLTAPDALHWGLVDEVTE
ncbi:enoyl-CoA hydratase/isomerase family protein [Streptomyces sp. NPDC047829]|uniref:enoyl-CoA hydratase/isomerase family protein n=1 Tax=Streptomyces sp. NPDC047829 TaxID=3154609 RepID=UPI0033D6FFDF